MTETCFGATDPGRMRSNNEDAFLAEAPGRDHLLGCVIDGVGGYEGGEVAAAIARQCIAESLQAPLSPDPSAQMQQAIREAHARISLEKNKRAELSQMACVMTLCVADTAANLFHYAHVGDTRLYLLRDQSLVKITKDHSFVGFLEDSGRLNELEAMQHPKRNEIDKALGFEPGRPLPQDYIDTGSSPFLPGDLLLLCSDGLTDLVPAVQIAAILIRKSSLAEKCAALLQAANEAGGKDNITAVLLRHPKAARRPKASRPAARMAESRLPESPQEPEPEAIAPQHETQPEAHPQKRGGHTALWLVSGLCLLLAAALAWQLWPSAPPPPPELVTPAAYQPHAAEIRLAQAIASAENLSLNLPDSLFGPEIILGKTLEINRDSLHLKANGLVLARDSAFQGPAISLGPACRYIILEGLELRGFELGIHSAARTLRLRNLRFPDCRIPLRQQFDLARDRYINGLVTDSPSFRADATPRTR